MSHDGDHDSEADQQQAQPLSSNNSNGNRQTASSRTTTTLRLRAASTPATSMRPSHAHHIAPLATPRNNDNGSNNNNTGQQSHKRPQQQQQRIPLPPSLASLPSSQLPSHVHRILSVYHPQSLPRSAPRRGVARHVLAAHAQVARYLDDERLADDHPYSATAPLPSSHVLAATAAIVAANDNNKQRSISRLYHLRATTSMNPEKVIRHHDDASLASHMYSTNAHVLPDDTETTPAIIVEEQPQQQQQQQQQHQEAPAAAAVINDRGVIDVPTNDTNDADAEDFFASLLQSERGRIAKETKEDRAAKRRADRRAAMDDWKRQIRVIEERRDARHATRAAAAIVASQAAADAIDTHDRHLTVLYEQLAHQETLLSRARDELHEWYTIDRRPAPSPPPMSIATPPAVTRTIAEKPLTLDFPVNDNGDISLAIDVRPDQLAQHVDVIQQRINELHGVIDAQPRHYISCNITCRDKASDNDCRISLTLDIINDHDDNDHDQLQLDHDSDVDDEILPPKPVFEDSDDDTEPTDTATIAVPIAIVVPSVSSVPSPVISPPHVITPIFAGRTIVDPLHGATPREHHHDSDDDDDNDNGNIDPQLEPYYDNHDDNDGHDMNNEDGGDYAATHHEMQNTSSQLSFAASQSSIAAPRRARRTVSHITASRHHSGGGVQHPRSGLIPAPPSIPSLMSHVKAVSSRSVLADAAASVAIVVPPHRLRGRGGGIGTRDIAAGGNAPHGIDDPHVMAQRRQRAIALKDRQAVERQRRARREAIEMTWFANYQRSLQRRHQLHEDLREAKMLHSSVVDPLSDRNIVARAPPPYSPPVPAMYPPPATYAHAEFIIKAHVKPRHAAPPLYSQQWLSE